MSDRLDRIEALVEANAQAIARLGQREEFFSSILGEIAGITRDTGRQALANMQAIESNAKAIAANTKAINRLEANITRWLSEEGRNGHGSE